MARYAGPGQDHSASRLGPALIRTIQQVQSAGVKKVILLGSSLEWPNDVPLLLLNAIRYHPASPVPHRLTRGLLLPQDDSFLQRAAQATGASYVSLVDKLCDAATCLATTGSGWQDIVTYDSNHFTRHGSDLVAPLLWSAIAPDSGTSSSTLARN